MSFMCSFPVWTCCSSFARNPTSNNAGRARLLWMHCLVWINEPNLRTKKVVEHDSSVDKSTTAASGNRYRALIKYFFFEDFMLCILRTLGPSVSTDQYISAAFFSVSPCGLLPMTVRCQVTHKKIWQSSEKKFTKLSNFTEVLMTW